MVFFKIFYILKEKNGELYNISFKIKQINNLENDIYLMSSIIFNIFKYNSPALNKA